MGLLWSGEVQKITGFHWIIFLPPCLLIYSLHYTQAAFNHVTPRIKPPLHPAGSPYSSPEPVEDSARPISASYFLSLLWLLCTGCSSSPVCACSSDFALVFCLEQSVPGLLIAWNVALPRGKLTALLNDGSNSMRSPLCSHP